MKIKLIILLLLFFVLGFGQIKKDTILNYNSKLEALPYYSFGKGLGITSPDSLFQLNIRFRMQNRVTYFQEDGEENRYEALIRRLRLRLDGYVGNPKFLYSIQLSFAPGDVGVIEEGTNLNIIRDAVFIYKPSIHWSFTFGQTKLPGNRQRVNSSGALQLVDRSINNASFNIDRDFGFHAYFLNENKDKFGYNIKMALSSGEGRNWTKASNDGVALTGKLELFPFGAFKNNGYYFEGDLVREKKIKLMLSGAYHQNNRAVRTQGQIGDNLFSPVTLRSIFFDGLAKYKGWSLMTAYMQRQANDLITYNPVNNTEYNFVFGGRGIDYQMSYNFPSNYEVIGRFSTQKLDKQIQSFAPNRKQYSLGLTKYLWEHSLKFQTEISYNTSNYFSSATKNGWFASFQVEIGI
ncbi:MAG TPA: porin [Flavobacterium sp.]|nr:porin [Flavobacterium sp.]